MEQPKSVKGLGIACTVFGLSGLLLLMPTLSILTADEIPPELQASAASVKVSLVISFVSLALMAAAGVGMLMFRPWGRWLGIVYAVTAIAGVAVITWLEVGALSVLAEEAAAAEGEVPTISWLSKMISLIIPVLTLYILTRPHIGRAFRGESDSDMKPLDPLE